jgi:hypothetical protein
MRIVIEADRRYAEPLLAKPPNESELRVDLVNGSVGVAWLTFTRPQVSTSRMSPQPFQDKRIQHGWKYGDHYMPHDIKHRELTTGRSRLQALNGLQRCNSLSKHSGPSTCEHARRAFFFASARCRIVSCGHAAKVGGP